MSNYHNTSKILCIGDSITFGYELDHTKKWTTLLGEELQAEVINCGVNGDTTAGMLSRFDNNLNLYNPTHVIITGGTNDLWFGLKDELIIANIFTMARQAKFCDIIPVIGIPPSTINLNELNFLQEDFAECVRSFQNTLLNFCKEKEILTIDFSKNMSINHYMEDGLHINEAGQNIMAINAAAILSKIM